MELLNSALKIIANLCPSASVPDSQPKQYVQQLLLEPLLADLPLVDAPSAPKEVIFTLPTPKEIICMPPAQLLEDAPLALKEVIDDYDFHDYRPVLATAELATGSF